MNSRGVLLRRAIAHALRPCLARELPGSGRLLGLCGADRDEVWRGTAPARTRLRWGAGVVELNRAEKYERAAWFRRRYHELPLLLLMNALLRGGDTFIDVGANLGLVSLHAARIVGSAGRVVAFEPNPSVRARLERHVAASGAAVLIDGHALGDRPGEFVLSVIGDNTGSGTLGEVPAALRGQVLQTYRVPVIVGDSLEDRWSSMPASSRVLLKVDAEGSETRVLRGLRSMIERYRPVIVTEVNPFALRMNGSGPVRLTRLMRSLGYDGFELGAGRLGLWAHTPRLGPMRPPRRRGLRDVVWTHPSGPWRSEIERLVVCKAAPASRPAAAVTAPP